MIDEDLLVDASQRWQDCRRDMLALVAGIPTVRSTIKRLLQEHLQLDGERVVLQFSATTERGRSRVTLSEACLYLQQHPNLDTTQVPAANVLHLPAQHALAAYSVAMLLDELKTLDLEQAIEDNWLRYWRTERAPNAPVTCRQRAVELYRAHFEASGEHLLAEGTVNIEVLTPLFSLVSSTPSTSDAQTIYVEQVLLKPVDTQAIALPGAWAITLDTEQPVNQLLYVPKQIPAWRTFSRRADMERWLLDQQQTLFSTRAVDALATIEYRIKHDPFDAGISLWLKQLVDNQYQDAIKPLTNVAIHDAYQALQHLDQLDVQRQAQSLFAQAPELPDAEVDTLNAPELVQFGLLHNAVDARRRKALVQQQRSAFERLLGNDGPTSPRWQSLKLQLDELKAQQHAAETSARAMLSRAPLDLTALNTHYTALYQARLQALRLEAKIQRVLDQISEDELKQVENALETPAPNVLALTLSVTRPGHLQPTLTELNGPLVFLPPKDPQTPEAREGTHFIYWPGNDGALQRFDSRQALEAGLFDIHPQDDVLALQFKSLSQDPFDYSLSSQQTAFDEHAARLRQTWAAPDQATTLAGELEKLREQTLPTLLVPDNTAREAAHLQLIEQYNTQVLAEHMQPWLRTQPADKHQALKTLLRAYLPAMRSSQALFERSLPRRDVFVRQQIDARLRKDFALAKGYTLQLDLPDTVTQKQDIIPGAAPGTPIKLIDVPSPQRSTLSVDALALHNIGSDISLRLGFVRVEVTADDANEQETLKAGITKHYLKSMVTDLDLAKRYEALIFQTFKGTPRESTYQKQYRRECLIEPLRLMLKAQGMLALMQNHISTDELQLLNIAIEADTQGAWEHNGKRIHLLPANLSIGGKDTGHESPITLSGVTFIEERNSGNTLLYLPDTPDERYLRGYTSLEKARVALFELCQLDALVHYMASRAIKGDVRAHKSRINQAIDKGNDSLFQVGVAWPATTSLAAHQLDAHMGRVLEAHRNDARSNDDLANEKYALQSAKLFNTIKIALSVVPLVGTAVSLVDAVTSLYQAVAAFRRGDIGDGIDLLASVFECLVFAAMDILTFAAVPTARASTARQLTATRQLKGRSSPDFWRAVKSRQSTTTRDRFAGYEHPGTFATGSLQPVQTGPYRHTLRHTSGDHFILSEGRYYKVRYDAYTAEMRLVAQGKYYSPVIALDQALQWDTHSTLYGGRLTGYGGGSRRRGRGAAQTGNVPPAVNRQLPAQVLEVNMQRLELGRSLRTQAADFYSEVNASTQKLKKYASDYPDTSVTSAQRIKDSKALDVDLARDIEGAKKMYTSFETAQQQQVRLPELSYGDELNRTAHILSDRLNHLIHHANQRTVALIDRTIAINQELSNLPLASATRRTLSSELRQCRLDMLDELSAIESSMKDMGTWAKRITVRATRTEVAANLDHWKQKFTDLRIASIRSGQLMQSLTRQPQTLSIDWIYQEFAVKKARGNVDRTITTHMTLPEANISRVERNRVLQNCIKVYEDFSRDLSAWNERSPDHFDPNFLQLLQKNLERLIRKAERAIKKPASDPKPNATRGVFETEDGQLLIGTEKPAGQQSPRQFIISDADGKTIEVWDKIGESNTFRLNPTQSQPGAAPPALPTDRRATLADAKARLDGVDAFEKKVRGYKTMEPVNLEHRLVTEAKELRTRANTVQSLEAGNPLVDQLRTRATALEQAGGALRIQRSLESPTPTEGYLDYLVSKHRVIIRKLGSRKKLRDKRLDGKDDYLQEYEIYDSNRQAKTDKPIWYAHFHYDALQSSFDSFPKAHLKLYEQRYLGMKWQAATEGAGTTFADTRIWRGNIDKPFARLHFQAVE
ncbi:dermonecrotic toxin domain-containing protein [Pseudomonas sp. L1(2025)]|uniref:dermonecrotic toxin domain-containing protein n=1 Tax=Pseudomonas sp. L1(2025) TaxID=3449429 RepID=UPI003F693BAA